MKRITFLGTVLSFGNKGDEAFIGHLYNWWVFKLILARILRAKDYGPVVSTYRVYGLLYGFVIVNSSIISDAFGGKFSIKNSLAKLL